MKGVGNTYSPHYPTIKFEMGGVGGGGVGGGRWEGIRTQSHTPHYPAIKFEMGGGGWDLEGGRWEVEISLN